MGMGGCGTGCWTTISLGKKQVPVVHDSIVVDG